MKTRLLIARHGNTFKQGEIPRRVGANTDIPLVESEKSRLIGTYLKQSFTPDVSFSGPLKRTYQTAAQALATVGLSSKHLTILDMFREIDYGPDENKPESSVIARIGEAAITAWNSHAIAPPGWKVDPKAIEESWLGFARMLENKHLGKNAFVVTSNGIARFSPILCGSSEGHHLMDLKVNTGALCLFEKSPDEQHWHLRYWNKRPTELLT